MCRSGCPTQDHASWGECARAANMRVSGDTVAKNNRDLNAYAYARSLGLQPPTSSYEDSVKTLRKVGA
jgi:hypothetical protein